MKKFKCSYFYNRFELCLEPIITYVLFHGQIFLYCQKHNYRFKQGAKITSETEYKLMIIKEEL